MEGKERREMKVEDQQQRKGEEFGVSELMTNLAKSARERERDEEKRGGRRERKKKRKNVGEGRKFAEWRE